MTDFIRKRGDTYADEFVIRNKVTKQPINLTGSSFLMTLVTIPDPTDTLSTVYQLTGTIVDAAAGRVEFSPSDVQADNVGTFYFDVQMIDGAGRKRTVDEGKYTYKQDRTKV